MHLNTDTEVVRPRGRDDCRLAGSDEWACRAAPAVFRAANRTLNRLIVCGTRWPAIELTSAFFAHRCDFHDRRSGAAVLLSNVIAAPADGHLPPFVASFRSVTPARSGVNSVWRCGRPRDLARQRIDGLARSGRAMAASAIAITDFVTCSKTKRAQAPKFPAASSPRSVVDGDARSGRFR